jgi:hypothetical protein
MPYSSFNPATVAAVGGGGGGSGEQTPFFNVLDYGAIADCVTLFDITMPNGNVVTSAGHTFVTADIGKWAIIRGATDAGGRSPLVGKITAVSGHTATLDTATTTALTNLHAGTSFPRMDFGTDNTWFFDLATLAVPGPGNRNYYNSTPFATSGTMNPILPGDGGTVYIPKGNYLLVTGYPFIAGTTYWWFEANNITIKGDGIGATNLFVTSVTNASPLIGGGFAGNHGYFQNVSIQDFTIFDLNYYSGAGNTINMNSINNLRIERVEAVNGKGNACINVQGARGITRGIFIRDCYIHGNQSDGYAVNYAKGIQGDGINAGELLDVHIERNRIEVPTRHGYEGGGVCFDQYFIENTIDMGSLGLSGINPTGGNRTVVAGNNIYNVGNADNANCYAIDFTCDVGTIFTCNDNLIFGNRCHGRGQALIRFQNTSNDTTVSHINNFSILGNQLVGTGTNSSGILLTGGPSGTANVEFPNGIISNNIFTGPANLVTVVNGYTGTPPSDRRLVISNNIVNANNWVIDANLFPCTQTIVHDNFCRATTPSGKYGGIQTTFISGSIAAGATTNSGNRTMTGARPGVHAVLIVPGSGSAAGLIWWGTVTANDTVVIYVYNPTAGALTAVDGKFYLRAMPQN